MIEKSDIELKLFFITTYKVLLLLFQTFIIRIYKNKKNSTFMLQFNLKCQV